MIDFACKRFNIKDVIKCGLGLTKADYIVFEYFLFHKRTCKTMTIADRLKLNLTTVQKAVKKLNEQGVVVRRQRNLACGGYVYTYECASKEKIRSIVKKVIRNWAEKVEEEIDLW